MSTTTAPTLTALDRCDRCGAQAQARATLLNGELLFCGHHMRQHAAALATTAATIEANPDHQF